MDYFGRRIRNRLRRVREGDIPGLTEKDCFDQQALLNQVLGEDRESTVFAIDHGESNRETSSSTIATTSDVSSTGALQRQFQLPGLLGFLAFCGPPIRLINLHRTERS